MPEPTVTPLAQTTELRVTGRPDVPNKYGSGHIRPTDITLRYQADGIRAQVYGRWVRTDGELTDAPISRDYAAPGGDTADWPGWLADLAREHAPTARQPSAGRAALLREAADAVANHPGPIPWPSNLPKGEGDGFWWDSRDRDAAAELLRRMADETPDTEAHPAEHAWTAELYDPLAKEWVPGTRYTDRDRAVNHLAHARSVGPKWKDGTPTQRRLVRETTTYTVEPEPAAGAQQDGSAS